MSSRRTIIVRRVDQCVAHRLNYSQKVYFLGQKFIWVKGHVTKLGQK